MSFLSDLSDKFKKAAKDVANGARGFWKGLIDGTTTGNSIGTLIGMAGCGLAAIFLGGLTFPAIVTGITVGALCGVVGGAIVGSIRGASENGAKLEQAENGAAPAVESQPAAAPSIPSPQLAPVAQAAAPVQSVGVAPASAAPAVVADMDNASTKFRDRHAPAATNAAEQRQPVMTR